MNSNAIAFPIILPMITGILLIILGRRIRWQRTISILSAVGGLFLALYLASAVWRDGIQTLSVGAFAAPYGIIFVADLLSVMMVVLSTLVAIPVLLTSFLSLDKEREEYYYYAFFQFLLMGLNGSFLTGDLFNLFVWFEVMLISSYILLTLGGEPGQLQEGFKYVIINVLASALFLVGVAVVYASLGTLNMADLAVRVADVSNEGLTVAIALVFLVVFGIKAAIFPLYFWLPRSYDAPPPAVAAIFGGLLTKVGVYALIRVFTLIFVQSPSITHSLILWISGLTLIIGVLGALAQTNIRSIISYHVISHIGYMLMGLGIFTPFALAGSLFYLAHDTIIKTALYLLSGVSQQLMGSTNLQRLRGIKTLYPGFAGLFFVGALSLAGVPPFSGFFGKFVLIQGSIEAGEYGMVAVALGVSLLIVYSMIQIFRGAFWGEAPASDSVEPVSTTKYRTYLVPAASLVLVSAVMGLGAQAFVEFTLQGAAQLMNPNTYIEAVLGPRA